MPTGWPRRITRRAWFGPKRVLGRGWTPTSWQGWAATGVLAAALAAVGAFADGRHWLVIPVVLAYLAVVVLTGDPPGGPRRGPRSRVR